MLQFRDLLRGGLATAVIVGAVVLSPSASASVSHPARPSSTCPSHAEPSTSGGQAAWTVECSGGKVFVDGWVKDTEADGKCAYVKAIMGGQEFHTDPPACPKGTVRQYHWSASGNIADVYLYVV